MGSPDQRTDLLRILLADDDDLHAFTLQCAINRLSKACAFLRVDQRESLVRKIRSFEPELLVLSGSFAAPGELRQIKPITNGCPIVCLSKTPGDAEASLTAGATDCVLLSQEDGLGNCLEKHLAGKFAEPHFRSAKNVIAKGRLSTAEEKLEQLDRRIGAWLRDLGKTTLLQWNRLMKAVVLACSTVRAWTSRGYRNVKIKYLLRKQHRLVQTSALETTGEATSAPLIPLASPMPDFPAVRESNPRPIQAESPRSEDESGSEALRAMELSFKTLFHAGLDAAFLLDGLGSILHVNPAGCALLGTPASELLGKTLLSFAATCQKAQASAMWEALLIEGNQKAELLFETASGEQRDLLVSGRANLWFGVHLLIIRDQTELKRLRAEVSAWRQREALDHQTSTGPFGTGIASRCADAGSMNEDTSGGGR